MMTETFYGIEASSNVKEYLKIGSSLDFMKMPCAMSEFQFLDRTPISAEVDEDSGQECQDFICEFGIPLVSERLKDFFDRFGIDYLFYKKIVLTRTSIGMAEPYWLALPPRIDCLDFEKSEIDDVLNAADSIIIDSSRIGRYDIFKLSRVTNLEIITTEKLALALKAEDFTGIHIYPIN